MASSNASSSDATSMISSRCNLTTGLVPSTSPSRRTWRRVGTSRMKARSVTYLAWTSHVTLTTFFSSNTSTSPTWWRPTCPTEYLPLSTEAKLPLLRIFLRSWKPRSLPKLAGAIHHRNCALHINHLLERYCTVRPKLVPT
eukprot:898391-Pleurochrysis_carterae.AAC.1